MRKQAIDVSVLSRRVGAAAFHLSAMVLRPSVGGTERGVQGDQLRLVGAGKFELECSP